MTSVTALGSNGRRASAASRLSIRIQRTASTSSSSPASSRLYPCSTRPVPSGFVRKTASPGAAVLFAQTASGCAVPTTASPYFGSSSRIVCPPASSAPAARTVSSAPSRISSQHARGQLLRKRRHGEREQRRSAHGKDVVERVRGRDGAEVARVVHDGRKEVDREDERAFVVELVDGRVVRRAQSDKKVLRLWWDKARQQLVEPPGRVLRRAAAGRDEL